MRDRLERLLGTRVDGVSDLGSSHAWTLHRASLADGREVFVKAVFAKAVFAKAVTAKAASASPRGEGLPATASDAGVFAAEAAGLRWLGEAGPGTPVPEVVAADDRIDRKSVV